MTTTFRSLAAVLATTGLIFGGAALAQSATAPAKGACCVQSTSLVDGWINPAIGSDEDFFTSRSGVPNVNLVIDTSLSMYMWPRALCAANDNCTCANMETGIGYDPSVTYESEIKNLNSGTFYSEWFNNNKVYNIPTNTFAGMELSDFGVNLNSGPTVATYTGANRAAAIADACSNIVPPALDLTRRTRCETCLATKGYFFGTDARGRRAVGNYLNSYSPRYLMMRRTVKQVVRDIRKVRMALTAFTTASMDFSSTEVPVQISDFNPPCNLSNPFTNGNNFDSNRQSIMSAVDALEYNYYTPLARTLWMAGYSFQQQGASKYDVDFPGWASTMGISSNVQKDFTEKNGQGRTICNKCMYNAVIILTDGEPNTDTDTPVDSKVPQIVRPDCPNCSNLTVDGHDLDEIARYLHRADLHPGLAGVQSVDTFTVGFGLDPTNWGTKLLQYTADEGGGDFYGADTSSKLKNALLQIFDRISERNTAFSSASIAPIQTESVRLAAVLPRMSPQQRKPWLGEVWRFELFNEFVEHNPNASPPVNGDRNGDGDTDDIFILDKNGAVVTETDEGEFVKAGTTTAAEPVWEARAKMIADGYANRKIYTVVDSDDNGRFDSSDTRLEVSVANWKALMPYLGIAGAPTCPTGLAAGQRGQILDGLTLSIDEAKIQTGVTFLVPLLPTQAELDELCAKALIHWVRGKDVGDEDSDGVRDETRDTVLGDIFHSSPIAVGAPVDRFLCDLGLSTQCVRTLYANDFGVEFTPLAQYPGKDCSNKDITRDAYDEYHYRQRNRDRVIMVGSNDGMLHAFHDGDAGPETCTNGIPSHAMVGTSGKELWAFIPPDLLPRLQERIARHTYGVDADLMIRDVWVDGNNDGTKQDSEFKTVVIAPEGRGGEHYFAIHLDFDATTGDLNPPAFRWIFPQPCSEDATNFGKTLYSLSPKPPPVGPVLLETSAAYGMNRHGGVKSLERWVAVLSGGWSPGMERGRGIYMVDAFDGVVNGRSDNLWWKFEYAEAAGNAQTDPRRFLTQGVTAPVALVDYGDKDAAQIDGFFDTAVFGDLRGQLWVMRMYQPGKAAAGGLISNWSGGRAFEMAKPDGNNFRRWPFYYLPTVGIQTDNSAMRVFVGSGSRYALLEERAGACRFDNPAACAKYGCSSVSNTYTITRPEITGVAGVTYTSGNPTGSLTETTATGAFCGNGVGTTAVTGRIVEQMNSCPGISNTTARDISYTCGERSPGDYRCTLVADGGTANWADLEVTPTSAQIGSLANNRYYGVWAFGGHPNRTFDETLTTGTTGTASGFDTARLTDRGGSGSGDLVDVTGATCTSPTTCNMVGAGYDQFGWFYSYEGLDHKTATGSTLLAGCTLWSGLYPEFNDGGVNDSCVLGAIPRARLFQGNYLSGLPNCAASFFPDGGSQCGGGRCVNIATPAPPPEPAPVVAINADGVMRVGVQMVPPGGTPQSFTVGQNNEPLQMVYELDVSRALHNCRHTDGGCAGVTP